jgi:L-aminopeptidase/D-esterase-like protein
MARAIYPLHALSDGDILFTATTSQVENPRISAFMLSHIASEVAYDAVLHSFEEDGS